jgi:hypothetical protein
VLFLNEGEDSLRKNNLKMTHYEATGLPVYICKFKKSETKKYRDAICHLLKLKYEAIAPDGNCLFAAVSACLIDLSEELRFSATELRANVVAWLVECKVCHHKPHKPVHHLTPPCYRKEIMDRLGKNATGSCFKS